MFNKKDLVEKRYWYLLAAYGLTAGILGWNIYRAFTLAIAHDEALAYLIFMQPGLAEIISPVRYHVNNHTLFALLAWGAIKLGGLSEFTLRLPSLLSGLLYLVVARRLCLLICGPTFLFLLGFMLLALNPLVLDFMVAARGYGLGLGLSLLAWYALCRELLRQPEDAPVGRGWLVVAGASMGLAVTANLVYVLPNLVLALVFVALILGRSRKQLQATLAKLGLFFALPGLIPLALYLPVLSQMTGDKFYAGSPSLTRMTISLLNPSLNFVPERGWWGLHVFPAGEHMELLSRLAIAVFLGALAPLLVVWYRRLKPGAKPWDSWERLYVFIAGGTAGTIGGLALNHYATGIPYPLNRTGLYLIPLALCCLLLVLKKGREYGPRAAMGVRVVCAVLLLLAAQFVTQLQADFLYVWKYDAGGKRVFALLTQQMQGKEAVVRIGHDWVFEPSLNFYRVLNQVSDLKPFERGGPNGEFDYYYLHNGASHPMVLDGSLRILYEDRVSRAVVAVPTQAVGVR